jgi:hypothetical protein
MTELEQFKQSIQNVSPVSFKNYQSGYKKLYKILGDDMDIASFSEKVIIKYIKAIPNPNSQQALINIGIQVRRLAKVEVSQLENLREENKLKIKELVKLKNVELAEQLPKYDELLAYLDELYDKSEYTDFVINWLLIHKQVRNKDLLFDIVLRKKDITDKTKNYMWWNRSSKKMVYIRNVYKTVGTYGSKKDEITDDRFITSIKRIITHQKWGEEGGVFIPTESQLGYYICKASYNKLCEGKTVKIVINHFRNNVDKLKEISLNRGTSVDTLLSNYDIEFQ